MRTTTKRKANTAMVFNPNRGLSRSLTVRKTAARKNPVRKLALAKTNPSRKRRSVRRRNNPATASGLLVAAVMAGVGVSLFDVMATRLIPQSSPLVRIGVKLGGAWLFQSSIGAKIPVLGKHKNDIALVLAVSGVVDAVKLWVLPIVSGAVSNLTNNALVLVQPPANAGSIAAGDATTGGIYPTAAYPRTAYA